MLKTVFLVSLISYVLICVVYYRIQNKSKQIGGPISKPKMFWLGFASYQYFILSAILYFTLDQPSTCYSMLTVLLFLLYFRGIVQSIFMFLFHIWTPPMGMLFNLFCFLYLMFQFYLNSHVFFGPNQAQIIISLYLILVSGILIVDSIYAYKFYKIVGSKTKGKDAIWYASETDPSFLGVIKLTRMLNAPFLLFFVYLAIKILAYS